MPTFLKTHYDTNGPFDIPMKDGQAKALESLLSRLPEGAVPKFMTLEKAPAELLPGERADVSWITTEDPDRDREVVIARGMDDSHFKLNPIVTLQHCYSMPPVGRSIWRKRACDGAQVGIKAKTLYPKRPDAWPQDDDWPSDVTFTLIQNGLLQGKSIGFLPLAHHAPTDEEIKQRPQWANVRRIIDKWLLLEYACVYLPCQQNAVVEAVSKGVKIPELLLEKIPPEWLQAPPETTTAPPAMPFTPWQEIEKAIARRIDNFDFEAIARRTIEESIGRLRGRI